MDNAANTFDISTLLDQIHPVIDYDWSTEPFVRMDLTDQNEGLGQIDLNDEESFTNFIFDQLKTANVPFGVGGYAEKRSIYSRSGKLFDYEKEEPRTIHLGIDIWGEAGTPVYTPLEGEVHSFANNEVHADYGPVIILKHEFKGKVFHTLYGHQSQSSLEGLYEGKPIKKGEQISAFGVYAENFHWPPHLHFQLILDMKGLKGDYPGVCKESEKGFYLSNCPDPSILLGLV